MRSAPVNLSTLSEASVVSFFDRLSTGNILTRHTGSIIGFIATIIYIIVVLLIIVPPAYLYFSGNFFESQFKVQSRRPSPQYLTNQDLILAMRFLKKQTNQVANHSEILEKLNTYAYYGSYNTLFKQQLQPCMPQYFKKAINPIHIDDCIMLPTGLLFDSKQNNGYLPYLQMFLSMKCDDVFKCNDNSPFLSEETRFIRQLNQQYYYEVIFDSQVLNDEGYPSRQLHRVYSTEYESPDSYATFLAVLSAQRRTYVDNSVMPWWNNMTYDQHYWTGHTIGADLSEDFLTTIGFFTDFQIDKEFRIAYRYYKKLDHLLGVIGGVLFLVYLMFWLPLSYINRTFQKIQNAEELLVIRDDIIISEQNLKKINIPFHHCLTRFLPGKSRNEDIITDAERQIDIVKLIKKLKVTHRNVRTKGLAIKYQTRDLDLDSDKPPPFNPDRPVLETLEMPLDVYQALKQAKNTEEIYQTNPTVLAIKESPKIDSVMEDELYKKEFQQDSNIFGFWKKIGYYAGEVIKFFDIFGAKPTLSATPENSSGWGFLLTMLIIILSILTFALTLYNLDQKKVMTSYTYESPEEHYYEMVTSQELKVAFCLDPSQIQQYLSGPNKVAELNFFKYSKKHGYEPIQPIRMFDGEFKEYFELPLSNFYSGILASECYKPKPGVTVPIGGSYETINEAYFGVRLDPFCSATPSQCANRKNATISAFLQFVNYNNYGFYMAENVYSPQQDRILPGISGNLVSQSNTMINGSLQRTETFFIPAIQLLDDTQHNFVRQSPKVLKRAMTFSAFGDRNEQKKGDITKEPAYILEFRPSGTIHTVLLRSYKIDFLLGVIGGVFLFWYFVINYFAKVFNTFKVRAKLAQLLHQQDNYDNWKSILYVFRIPKWLFCCGSVQQQMTRIQTVDEKIKRDLNYLSLIKQVDNCYRLSSSLFENQNEKNLALLYFKEKIDQSEMVVSKKQEEVEFEDDEFLDFDDQQITQNPVIDQNATSNLIPQTSMANQSLGMLEKLINVGRSSETVPLYDPFVPYNQQSCLKRWAKHFDLFKNPPQLTLDGQRDVKSKFGGLCFFIVLLLIILVGAHFVGLYLDGQDYTISHKRFIDAFLNTNDPKNPSLNDINPGLELKTGQNFKLAVAFHKKDQYFPLNVSNFIAPIGMRILKIKIQNKNGVYSESYDSVELVPCPENYFENFIGQYNDPQVFSNMSLGYCVPDGEKLVIKGTPEHQEKEYFKVNIYNKYGNSTGTFIINSFFRLYIPHYYYTVPKLDFKDLKDNFQYTVQSNGFMLQPQPYAIQNNFTLSKLIFTDRYYDRSIQTYNDKTPRQLDRLDYDLSSNDSVRNVSFYYDGIIDRYTLDYPGGGELFGLVGGIIGLFVFFIWSAVVSFNEYRMKYLIGQRLYLLDKKLSGIQKQKKKKVNKKKLQLVTKKMNNYDEIDLLQCWIMSFLAFFRNNYNFNKKLRRVTLVIRRVEEDINLFSFYTSLKALKSALDQKIHLVQDNDNQSPITLTSVYPKHIFNHQPVEAHIPAISRQAKKYRLSDFEQFKINKAMTAKINPQPILGGNKVLNKAFGIQDTSSSFNESNVMERQNNQGAMEMPEGSSDYLGNTNTKFNPGQQQVDRQRGSEHFEPFQIQQVDRE